MVCGCCGLNITRVAKIQSFKTERIYDVCSACRGYVTENKLGRVVEEESQ
jgi:hypothetical protein